MRCPLSITHLSVRLSRKIHRYRQQKTIRGYLQSHTVRKLQLGCGGNPLPGWLNTDLEPSDEMVLLDVRQSFPFEDSSFDYVFSEHSIEHVSYQHGLRCLKECFRVLRPGGRIRISTPNLAFVLGLYNGEKCDLQKRYISWSVETFLPAIESSEDTFVINNFFRNWNHQFIYDFKILRQTIQKTGFVDVQRFPVGESEDPHLRGLESHGNVVPSEFNELETMVAEGTKPSQKG